MTQHLTAEEWNERYPIGTPVTAYPGCRPDDPAAELFDSRTLKTRTRSKAWTLGGHTPVVLVDGYAGGIALEHVDPQGQAEETYDQKCERLRLSGAAELSRRYAERSGWVVCSPEWLADGGDCHNAPRRLSADPQYSHEHPITEETVR